MERVLVQPRTRELAATATVGPVNMGYAMFDTDSTSPVEIRSQGSGAFLLVVYDDVHVGFLPPFGPSSPSNPAVGTGIADPRGAGKYPRAMSYIRQIVADPVAAEMAMETTSILPFSEILLMSKDDYLRYSLTLREKGSFQRGLNEVQFFKSAYARGIARIGDSPNDRRVASVLFESFDGTRRVGMHLGLRENSSRDVATALDPILRSFRFTVNRVDEREAVRNLIIEAGIQPEDDIQDGATNGTLPEKKSTVGPSSPR